MKNSIRKMIEEYNEKVKLEDIRLESVGEQIKKARAAGECYEDLRSDKKVINARRQAYIQAAVDFDSLLDNI
jgi:hypothetical protein